MRFGGLVKRKAPRDMDLERPGPRRPRRFDKAIEFLDRLRVRHSVVGLGINSERRLGLGFDAVGIRDAGSRAHRGGALSASGPPAMISAPSSPWGANWLPEAARASFYLSTT